MWMFFNVVDSWLKVVSQHDFESNNQIRHIGVISKLQEVL